MCMFTLYIYVSFFYPATIQFDVLFSWRKKGKRNLQENRGWTQEAEEKKMGVVRGSILYNN